MKTLTEIRADARKDLAGKWGKAALIMLVYGVITWAISFVLQFIPVVGSLAAIVIELPITYGIIVSMIKLKRGEEVSYVEFLVAGFNSFKSVWAVFGNILLKMIIPVIIYIAAYIFMFIGISMFFKAGANPYVFLAIGYILLIVAGIWSTIKGLYYALSYFILYDNPDMTGKEIVEKSEKLMTGNRARFFFLPLTFIGWMILACLTLGIGYLWLAPYMFVAMVCFYESLAGTKTTVETKVETAAEETTSTEE